jgi:hypothetical protein
MAKEGAGYVGASKVGEALEVEHGEYGVEDVEAVAIFSEEAHDGSSEDMCGAGSRLEAHGDEAGGGESEQGETQGKEQGEGAAGGAVIECEDGDEKQR